MIAIINHSDEVKDRFAAAKKAVLDYIELPESLIRLHDHEQFEGHHLGYLGKRKYLFRLFQFPKGTSKQMVLYRMRRSRYGMFVPADPAHMLGFAEHYFKNHHSFGQYHSYVVGLGGELQTVLGAQFGGINFGMRYFFQHLPQNKWTHDGGEDTRFLGVRELGKQKD